jgi:2-polyprenyl-3-methyl-5-hydroxy-6-metoxy-1,4-benzoquinol methylase
MTQPEIGVSVCPTCIGTTVGEVIRDTIKNTLIYCSAVQTHDSRDPAHGKTLSENHVIAYPLFVQDKHPQWQWQWTNFHDDNQWLFTEWIWPNTLEEFRGKDVLDCGCGGGQHITFTAPYAQSVTGVDLNAISCAQEATKHLENVKLVEADLAEMNLGKTFDIVYCIGVLHHTDDPDRTFATIARHCKPGGRVIVWVYSKEGNFLNRTLLEWLKRAILLKLPRSVNLVIAHILTLLLYVPIYTLYLLPLRFLPFFEYFQNWRKLSYRRNLLNVFDKLNAPQTHFITQEQITAWFNPDQFSNTSITPYRGVSWRGSGTVTPEYVS